eukprot:107257-Prymnesium_polylepis.1
MTSRSSLTTLNLQKSVTNYLKPVTVRSIPSNLQQPPTTSNNLQQPPTTPNNLGKHKISENFASVAYGLATWWTIMITDIRLRMRSKSGVRRFVGTTASKPARALTKERKVYNISGSPFSCEDILYCKRKPYRIIYYHWLVTRVVGTGSDTFNKRAALAASRPVPVGPRAQDR